MMKAGGSFPGVQWMSCQASEFCKALTSGEIFIQNETEAIVAGMRIVPIGVDRNGNINMEELKQKAQDNSNE